MVGEAGQVAETLRGVCRSMSPSFLEQLTAAHSQYSVPSRCIYSNGRTARIVATGVAVAACTFAFGYQAGLRSLSKPSISESKDIVPETLAHEEEGSDSEDEQAADGDLSSVKAGWVEPCKLVSALSVKRDSTLTSLLQALVVRTDLGMSSGKIAAQCGHATLACYKALVKVNPNVSICISNARGAV